jgi:catechol 2,3-dioxygenase-like lactoylglutathione lyase family enzyme
MWHGLRRASLLSIALWALLLGAPPAVAQQALVTEVAAVGVTVSDMDRSVKFFTEVLTFEKVSDVEVIGGEYERLQGVFGLRMRVVRLKLGEEMIELTEYLAPRGRPVPVEARSNDRWFQHVAIIVTDMDRAYARLRQFKVEHASTGPQTLPAYIPAAAGIKAFYFKDPDGHALEILQFPAGKGDRKWHRATGQLFLGIDHTAIVVRDTEASLKFYRDTLGLRIAGESENYGPEQEHLNNVFGARLRITALRAASGPGIELLEYLAPRTGRAYPSDARANDLIHWQTHLTVHSADGAASAVRSGRFEWVSPGAVSLPQPALGWARGVLVRDPDGHAVLLVEKQDGPGGQAEPLSLSYRNSDTRPRPMEMRLAKFIAATTWTASSNWASLQPAARAASQSAFSTSAGWPVNLSARRKSASTLDSTGACG